MTSPLLQISASAGSGKTYTLTKRFLELLESASSPLPKGGCALDCPERGYALAEIVAATFTNKAAAEMKERILRALKEKALSDSPGAAPLWTAQILRHYGALNVRTIDSLLCALVRLSALSLDLPPDFSPAFSPAEYFDPVYDGLMDDLALAAEGASPLFLTSDAAALRAALEETCRTKIRMGKVRGFAAKQAVRGEVKALVEEMLHNRPVPETDAEAVHALLHKHHAVFVASTERFAASLEEHGLKSSTHAHTFLERCAACSAYEGPPAGAYVTKEDADDFLLKASKGKAPEETLSAFNNFRLALAAYASRLPLLLHALQLAAPVRAAREVYARMADGVRRDKKLPAARIPYLAAQALSGEFGVTDGLCRLGARLTHLLLDEFQDTSREQWEALRPLAAECLSLGGSLTWVGDVKQAVYSWRGGDSRLFNAVLDEEELTCLSELPPQAKKLEYNWRSAPEVVAHNSAFFMRLADPAIARKVMGGMLPRHVPHNVVEDAGRELAAIFADAAQNMPADRRGAEPGCVTLYMAEGKNSATVRNMVEERLHRLFTDELLTRFSCRDIAVLVRTKTEGALASAWLAEWGLPVVTENSFRLADHPLVQRLLAFLAFLDDTGNDTAFWEFVTGPECFGAASGLRAAELNDWAAKASVRSGKKRPPLYRLFQEAYPKEYEAFIAPFTAEAGAMSVYDLLAAAAARFGLLRPGFADEAFVQRLLEVAHAAEGRGLNSVSAFLAFWQENGGEEKLPLPESMDAVRVMTMHKAKGLEFPVVVLPFGHKQDPRDDSVAATVVDGLPLMTRRCPELQQEYCAAAVTKAMETLNLLYVAWTRPVRELHAFITRPESDHSALKKSLEILLEGYAEESDLCRVEYLSPQEAEDAWGEEDEEGGLMPSDNFLAGEETAPSSLAPDLSRHPMDFLPRLRMHGVKLDEITLSPARRGTLAHLCLELFRPSPDWAGDAARLEEAARRAVKAAFRRMPVPGADASALAEEMREMLLWFANLPGALARATSGLREQALMGADGSMHRIDLLADEGDALCAVDYKTGAFSGQAHEGHLEQVRRYMRLLHESTGRPARGLLIYLDARRLEEVTP